MLKPGTNWEPYIAHFPCKYYNHIARFTQFSFFELDPKKEDNYVCYTQALTQLEWYKKGIQL